MQNIRNFFIAFGVSLIGFALIAWFIIGKFVTVDEEPEISVFGGSVSGDVHEVPIVDDAPKNTGENELLTGLVACLDENTGRADSIVVVNINKNEKLFTVCTIPSYLMIDIGSVKYKKEVYLGDILSDDSISDTSTRFNSMVSAITGLDIDYYVYVTASDFVGILDEMGGVEYDVPFDMYYKDSNGNVVVNLDEELEHLNGKQTLQLLRFKNYEDIDKTSDDGDSIRRHTHNEIIKTVFDTLLVNTDKDTVNTIGSKLIGLVSEGETNFTETALVRHMDLILNYSQYRYRYIDYPVKSTDMVKFENGETIAVHLPDTEKAFDMIKG